MYHVSFFNLLTGAERPVSENQNRINHVEYNQTLKHRTFFPKAEAWAASKVE
ncbi:hypothetical protein LEP1GSC071_0272 [Leptospira santarosai str. JET]|nr:hypothetical protein LEP1GSC071_0272 [Leptospira santarosai str. JET]